MSLLFREEGEERQVDQEMMSTAVLYVLQAPEEELV
jgi:hypothetical protein